MKRRLTLLFGAHKTASTHLQRSLTGSRKALTPQGVGVIGPMPIGADIIPLSGLLRGRADPKLLQLAADAFLTREAHDAEQVVLMNENVLGTLAPNMLLQDDRLYKFAPGRIKRVLQLFEHQHFSVGVAIRAPETFLVSGWQENMKGHAFEQFRDYLGQTDVAALQWHQTVKRIQNAIGDIPILIWKYEDYPKVTPKLLAHMIGPAADAVTLQTGTANPGFSADAIAHLQPIGEVTKDTTRDALALFPKGDAHPAYRPWTNGERAALAAIYREDCSKLAAMDNVTFVRP
jgi:hypothetical protein